MKIITSHVQKKEFKPFDIIITIDDVVDLRKLHSVIKAIKNSDFSTDKSIGFYLQDALNCHFGNTE